MKLLGCKVCGDPHYKATSPHGFTVACGNEHCPAFGVLMQRGDWNQRCKGEVEANRKLAEIKETVSPVNGCECDFHVESDMPCSWCSKMSDRVLDILDTAP